MPYIVLYEEDGQRPVPIIVTTSRERADFNAEAIERYIRGLNRPTATTSIVEVPFPDRVRDRGSR